MQFIAIISVTLAVASAQYAAWPSTSYSPYFQSLYAGAANPVLAEPVVGAGYAPAAGYAAPSVYGSLPVAAAPALAAASVNGYAAPEFVEPAAAVPAYSPFQNTPYFIGSNKGKSGRV